MQQSLRLCFLSLFVILEYHVLLILASYENTQNVSDKCRKGLSDSEKPEF